MPVIAVDVKSREPYETGICGLEYERLDGTVIFGVDPANAANSIITDLHLARLDQHGLVQFSCDFCLLHNPAERLAGSCDGPRVLVDVVNRGRKIAVKDFNVGVDPAVQRDIPCGDGFLFSHGFAVLSIGWQWDVYSSGSLLGLQAPLLRCANGRRVPGQAIVEMWPNAAANTWALASREHKPYPAIVDGAAGEAAVLLVSDWHGAPEQVVPRHSWRFARQEDQSGSAGSIVFSGRVVPSKEHIYLESGFIPGKFYQLIYTAEAANLAGAGLLAVREAAGWLRQPTMNLLKTPAARVYGYGNSQTGRLLRHFLHLGLNTCEDGSRAYDALLPHVAGARFGEFNHRFAQPSQGAWPTASFGRVRPFRTADILAGFKDSEYSATQPRVILTNTAAEYWRGDASLAHMDLSDHNTSEDLQDPPGTRSYLFASTQHGTTHSAKLVTPEVGTPPVPGDDGFITALPKCVLNYQPLLRAQLMNLVQWVEQDFAPPPSAVPRLADGTAADRIDVLRSFPTICGFRTPAPERLWVTRELDLGPQQSDGIGNYPAPQGAAIHCAVSTIDSDGNELAGVRLPDLTAPVGTHAGWNTRHAAIRQPEQIVPMSGSTVYFAPTPELAAQAGDSRPALSERYESVEHYQDLVTDHAEALVAARMLLPEDTAMVVANCVERYEAAAKGTYYPPKLPDGNTLGAIATKL